MVIKRFFDDNSGLIGNTYDAEEMALLKAIVYRYVLDIVMIYSQIPSIHGHYLTTWLNQYPEICLSEEAVSLIFRFCRCEGLVSIHDMLSRV